jgi:hypothetical protein
MRSPASLRVDARSWCRAATVLTPMPLSNAAALGQKPAASPSLPALSNLSSLRAGADQTAASRRLRKPTPPGVSRTSAGQQAPEGSPSDIRDRLPKIDSDSSELAQPAFRDARNRPVCECPPRYVGRSLPTEGITRRRRPRRSHCYLAPAPVARLQRRQTNRARPCRPTSWRMIASPSGRVRVARGDPSDNRSPESRSQERATYLVLRAARNAGSGRLPSGLEGLCVDQEGSGMGAVARPVPDDRRPRDR